MDGTLLSTLVDVLSANSNSIAAIILREQVVGSGLPAASDAELQELCQELLPLCTATGVRLLVHGQSAFAEHGIAHGVHLNAKSNSVARLRPQLPELSWIGYSAHSLEESKMAASSGADYVFLSPVFSPLSKQDTRPTLGTEQLKLASEHCPERIVALGGITSETIGQCRVAGVRGVAAISSGVAADDPVAAVRELAEAWDRAAP